MIGKAVGPIAIAGSAREVHPCVLPTDGHMLSVSLSDGRRLCLGQRTKSAKTDGAVKGH